MTSQSNIPQHFRGFKLIPLWKLTNLSFRRSLTSSMEMIQPEWHFFRNSQHQVSETKNKRTFAIERSCTNLVHSIETTMEKIKLVVTEKKMSITERILTKKAFVGIFGFQEFEPHMESNASLSKIAIPNSSLQLRPWWENIELVVKEKNFSISERILT